MCISARFNVRVAQLLVAVAFDALLEDQDVARAVHQFVFVMIRRPPRSTLVRSSAASDVYKRQGIT